MALKNLSARLKITQNYPLLRIFFQKIDNSWDKHKNLVDGIIQCLQGVTDESVYMLRVLNLHF